MIFSLNDFRMKDRGLNLTYRLHCSQYIYDSAVQPLPVGHYVSQRVEIPGVLHWQVDQWQQSVDGAHVSTQIHLGMSLSQQQPVQAETTHTSPLTPSSNVTSHFTQYYMFVKAPGDKCVKYLGVVGQNLSPFSGSLLVTKGFSIVTGKNTRRIWLLQ